MDCIRIQLISNGFKNRFPPMGLFYPLLLVQDEYPPPPRSW
uniref:Uncharacterized protein n=1 Tax=Nelumbo nucifera TaxID=4432 RepID=A0A822Z8D0_NELNU|nr:TPA_asm: hypothetical protein HUJ06_014254 [Nelumbo nucifera]